MWGHQNNCPGLFYDNSFLHTLGSARLLVPTTQNSPICGILTVRSHCSYPNFSYPNTPSPTTLSLSPTSRANTTLFGDSKQCNIKYIHIHIELVIQSITTELVRWAFFLGCGSGWESGVCNEKSRSKDWLNVMYLTTPMQTETDLLFGRWHFHCSYVPPAN